MKKILLYLFVFSISQFSFAQIGNFSKTISGKYIANLETNSLWTTPGSVPFLVLGSDGKYYQSFEKMEPFSRTITISNNMSNAQIQSSINEVGRYLLPNVQITFLFKPGIYTNHSLQWRGFHGPGTILITSTDTYTSAYTTQSVTIDGSSITSQGDNCLFGFYENRNSYILIKNIHFKQYTPSGFSCVSCNWNLNTDLYYNYFEGTSIANGWGVSFQSGRGYVEGNYFSNMNGALLCQNSAIVLASYCYSTGTLPGYGYLGWYGSYLGVANNYMSVSSTLNWGYVGGTVCYGRATP